MKYIAKLICFCRVVILLCIITSCTKIEKKIHDSIEPFFADSLVIKEIDTYISSQGLDIDNLDSCSYIKLYRIYYPDFSEYNLYVDRVGINGIADTSILRPVRMIKYKKYRFLLLQCVESVHSETDFDPDISNVFNSCELENTNIVLSSATSLRILFDRSERRVLHSFKIDNYLFGIYPSKRVFVPPRM